jgi:endonuclease/exonuclease/phosphatase family metal-dependent hydrolase
MVVADASIRALTWNLFHGRADPGPTPRSLLPEFRAVLAAEPWDVALLQEAPPRWLVPLCEGLGAHGALALTARNLGAPLRRRVAEWRPDLLGAWEGGSNQLLIRPPWRILETRRLVLARVPERRRLLWARLGGARGEELAVGCLHLTVRHPAAATREAVRAAAWARDAAGDRPLLLGGDFNVHADSTPSPFEELERRVGRAPPPGAGRLDHLLVAGLSVVEAPRALARERREVTTPAGLRLRLSDHPPVVASYAIGTSQTMVTDPDSSLTARKPARS